MNADILYVLRSYGIQADVRALLLFRKAVINGLVTTLGDIFNTLKGIVVKSPEDLGPFTKAFYDYFLNIDIGDNERLSDAILRSETFRQWKTDLFERIKDAPTDDDMLVTRFLNDVHITHYDIKKILNGKDIFDNDDPYLEDSDEESPENPSERRLDRMADYSDLSLDELLKRLEEIADRQRKQHGGGSHWIGTGGISPFGHGGAAKDGLRIGGTGGGKMARKVIGDRKFFPVDKEAQLNDNNIDAALAALKGIQESSAEETLQIDETITQGIKNGGVFLPHLDFEIQEKLRVILLIDNGGYSMDPYINTVQKLFKKMKTRYAHDLETYYFHNTIYDVVYKDARRLTTLSTEKLLKKEPIYRVFIIGDASMAPYELNKVSLRFYKKLKSHFSKVIWLNPEPKKYWDYTFTIKVINQMMDMFPLTPKGIEEAILNMNKK